MITGFRTTTAVLLMVVVMMSGVAPAGTNDKLCWLEKADQRVGAGECHRARCVGREGSCDVASWRLCVPPLVCSGSASGVCSPMRQLGGNCTESSQCVSGDWTVYDRVCSPATSQCVKKAGEGQACGSDGDCDSLLTCHSRYCTALGKVRGESCSDDGPATRCKAGLVCAGLDCLDHLCVPQFSQRADMPCLETSCAQPLVCSNSRKACIPVTSSYSSRAECKGDSDCADDQSCTCDSRTGKMYCSTKAAPSTTELRLYNNFVSCVKSHTYDPRPCYPKKLVWLQAKWSARREVPVPELYCLLGAACRVLVPAVVLAAFQVFLLMCP